MKGRMRYAWKETQQDVRGSLLPSNPERSYLAIFAVIASVFGCILCSAKGIGGSGYVPNFIAGCISSALFLLFAYGGILLFAVVASMLTYMRRDRQRYPPPATLTDKLIYGLAGIITVLIVGTAFLAASSIPIVGDQLNFMFRDRN